MSGYFWTLVSFPVVPDSKAIAYEWQFLYFIFLPYRCQLNLCCYFCQDCCDSLDCPDGLLTNLWFHKIYRY